jgi:hypothetical protein
MYYIFPDVYPIFYEFWKFKRIFGDIESSNEKVKGSTRRLGHHSAHGPRLDGLAARLLHQAASATVGHMAHARLALRGRGSHTREMVIVHWW